MEVVFRITEINYLNVSLICDFVRPLFYLYLRCLVLRLRYLPCFWHSDKSNYGFPKLIHHVQVGAHHTNLFSNKIFALNSVLQIARPIILF